MQGQHLLLLRQFCGLFPLILSLEIQLGALQFDENGLDTEYFTF
jgi:hypothetical protein